MLVIDVKGDLPNLLLAFPDFDPRRSQPWVERESAAPDDSADRTSSRARSAATSGARALERVGHRRAGARGVYAQARRCA